MKHKYTYIEIRLNAKQVDEWSLKDWKKHANKLYMQMFTQKNLKTFVSYNFSGIGAKQNIKDSEITKKKKFSFLYKFVNPLIELKKIWKMYKENLQILDFSRYILNYS